MKELKALSKNLMSSIYTFLFRPIGAILMYHRVDSIHYDFLGPDKYTVTPEIFEKHIEFLNSEFTIISLLEFYQGLRGIKGLPEKPIVITFDDGFHDNYINALPILEKFQTPATLFISTGFIGNKSKPIEFVLADIIQKADELKVKTREGMKQYKLDSISSKRNCYKEMKAKVKYEKPKFRENFIKSLVDQNNIQISDENEKRLMLNWSECSKLGNNILITIGSHGINHIPLSVWRASEKQIYELKQSKNELEDCLGSKILYFSYPYGVYDGKIAQLVRKANYKTAFCTREMFLTRRDKERLFQLPRLSAPVNKIQNDKKINRLIR